MISTKIVFTNFREKLPKRYEIRIYEIKVGQWWMFSESLESSQFWIIKVASLKFSRPEDVGVNFILKIFELWIRGEFKISGIFCVTCSDKLVKIFQKVVFAKIEIFDSVIENHRQGWYKVQTRSNAPLFDQISHVFIKFFTMWSPYRLNW